MRDDLHGDVVVVHRLEAERAEILEFVEDGGHGFELLAVLC